MVRSQYPRAGCRLAPLTLKEALLARAAAGLVRGTPFQSARLCDLDETVWQHLPRPVIERLARSLIAHAATGSRQLAILARPLPPAAKAVRLADLPLENRTYHCLLRAGLGAGTEDLAKLTVGDLLSLRGFGTKCLVDLLSSLETLAVGKNKLDKRVAAAARALAKMPAARAIQGTDPRLGPLLHALDTEANTLGELLDRIFQRRIYLPDSARACAQLRQLRDRIGELAGLPLEDELIQIFTADCGKRDRKIVTEYYGWDGRGGSTLEELGRKHRLSRERIRQVCVQAVRRARNTTVYAPVLDRAIALLAERFPTSLEQLQAEFDAGKISACGLKVEAVRQAARFLSRPFPCAIIDIGGRRLVVDLKFIETPCLIVRAARQVAMNYGVGTIREVAAELSARSAVRVSHKLVRQTMHTVRDFRWLDARQTWFRAESLPQCGLPGAIEKILSVVGRIDIVRLRTALARCRRNRRELPPRGVLLEFCRQMPSIHVERSTIVSTVARDWKKALGGVERIVVDVLKSHGPVMQRAVLEECCLRKGVNRFSFNAAVTGSPVIAQHGRSVYGLLGEKVSRKTIERLVRRKPGTRPVRVA